MNDTVKFKNGFLFHDMIALADIQTIVNIDTLVVQEFYYLLKKDPDGNLAKRFPKLIPFVESFHDNMGDMATAVQMRTNENPLLDFYNWGDTDGFLYPFTYTDAIYCKLYYQELDVLKVPPLPTLIGNLLAISVGLDEFKKLYILSDSCPEFMKTQLNLMFKGSSKVELLEGTLEEAVKEIKDINFFIINNVDNVKYLMHKRDVRAEVLIPAYRSNLLNGDLLEEEPPVLALPEGMDNYGSDFNLSINSIAIPI